MISGNDNKTEDKMSLETNKQTVLGFLKSLSSGKPDASYLCADAQWWVPGIGTVSRETFFAMADNFHNLVKAPAVIGIDAVTAEEDRVAVEAHASAELLDGRMYENTYHFLFYLRDGKILEAREHNNSAIPAALFGGTLSA
jgi:ketosteroid isomerase-like protein